MNAIKNNQTIPNEEYTELFLEENTEEAELEEEMDAIEEEEIESFDYESLGTAKVGDALTLYLKEMKNLPLLTDVENRELSKRIENGDMDAVRKMTEGNLRMVVFIAKKYRTNKLPLMDLIQEGNIGLMNAAKRFDYKRNCKFSTFAFPFINKMINDAIMGNSNALSISIHHISLMRQIDKAVMENDNLFGEPLSHEDISKLTGISVAMVKELTMFDLNSISMDSVGVKDTESSLSGVIADKGPSLEDIYEADQLKVIIGNLLKTLSPKEASVIEMRFGFNGPVMVLDDIAKELNLSKSRIFQLEKAAMKKFKVPFRKEMLESFVNVA